MRSRSESDARLRSLESAMRVGGLDDVQIDKYFSDMMTKEEMLPYIEGAEQQGYSRGLEEGKAEGRAEGIAQIAKALLSKGLAKELVSEITEISIDQLDV